VAERHGHIPITLYAHTFSSVTREAAGVLGRAIGRESPRRNGASAQITIPTRDWLPKSVFGQIGWML
jgi:hypothetical protein